MNQNVEYYIAYTDDLNRNRVFEGSMGEVYVWLKDQEEDTLSRIKVWHTRETDPSKAYITVEKFLKQCFALFGEPKGLKEMFESHNPELDCVQKFRSVDTDEEEILFDGFKLCNGLRVLIYDTKYRQDMEFFDRASDVQRGLQNNRWCKVTQLQINGPKTMVKFIGVYDDGSQYVRVHNIDDPWIVTKESLKEHQHETQRLAEAITGYVKGAMTYVPQITLDPMWSEEDKVRLLGEHLEATVRSIMDEIE